MIGPPPKSKNGPLPGSDVLDLFIASARGPGLTALERWQLAQLRAATTAQTPGLTDCMGCERLRG
jgi:hypothetical protein